jgi:hypothetical protein
VPERDLPSWIETPNDVEVWADYVQERVTPKQVGDDVIYGPEWVIRKLEEVSAAAGTALLTVKAADRVRRAAARELAKAKAKAQTDATATRMPAADRPGWVAAATQKEADYEAVCRGAYDYAKAVSELVDKRRSSIQTIAKMVEATYSTAGRGRS